MLSCLRQYDPLALFKARYLGSSILFSTSLVCLFFQVTRMDIPYVPVPPAPPPHGSCRADRVTIILIEFTLPPPLCKVDVSERITLQEEEPLALRTPP